jgi:hypothetical protein
MILSRLRTPRRRFHELILRRPKLGCVLACGSYAVGTPMMMSDNPFLHLLAVGLLVVMAAAYQPLRAYVEDLDHDRVFARNYKLEDRKISTKMKLDDYEARLVKRALSVSHWLIGGLFALSVWYVMPALWLGLWLPNEPNQLTWLVLGIAALTVGSPTVIMAWIYKDDSEREWSVFEDAE